jgi:very-short-patch-repair endonuclease
MVLPMQAELFRIFVTKRRTCFNNSAMTQTLSDMILQILINAGPVTTKEIQSVLADQKIDVERDAINSILYGELRNQIIRDRNAQKIPIWRIRRGAFEAASGLERRLYERLIEQNIITSDTSHLDYTVRNRRNNKIYHLDIAIILEQQKYNIEVDGFDHVRADALASIERQVKENGENTDIDIDWMDNEKSFIAFDEIDTKIVYHYLLRNIDWCIRFHEELLWPKDITRNLWLIESGWKIMRFWNMEVSRDLDSVSVQIKDYIT